MGPVSDDFHSILHIADTDREMRLLRTEQKAALQRKTDQPSVLHVSAARQPRRPWPWLTTRARKHAALR